MVMVLVLSHFFSRTRVHVEVRIVVLTRVESRVDRGDRTLESRALLWWYAMNLTKESELAVEKTREVLVRNDLSMRRQRNHIWRWAHLLSFLGIACF